MNVCPASLGPIVTDAKIGLQAMNATNAVNALQDPIAKHVPIRDSRAISAIVAWMAA